jgi:hypothetical protein
LRLARISHQLINKRENPGLQRLKLEFSGLSSPGLNQAARLRRLNRVRASFGALQARLDVSGARPLANFLCGRIVAQIRSG